MHSYYLAADIFLENEKGEVLLLKRNKNTKVLGGYYNGIGGKFDAFETPLEAIRREVKEEIGITKIKGIALKMILTVHDQYGYWLIFCYTGQIKKMSIKKMIIPEGTLEWIAKKDFARKKLVPDLKVWYKRLFQKGISYVKVEYDETYRMNNITPVSVSL